MKLSRDGATNVHYSGELHAVPSKIAGGRRGDGAGRVRSLGSQAVRHSAGLVFFLAGDGIDLGSATCIRVSDRYLLATAGHNLDGVARDESIRIVAPKTSRDRWLPFRGRNATRDRGTGAADVGWVELDPATARSSGLSFLDSSALGRRRPREDYFVQGLPAGLACHGLHARGRVIHLTAMGYVTRPVKRGSVSPPSANEGRGLHVEYDDRRAADLPAAHGMSGGGVWAIHPGRRGRARLRLAGLVRAWHPKERRLSGIRIHHWLALVREDFPDLRPTLDPVLENLASDG